jgi:hypothetical protein
LKQLFIVDQVTGEATRLNYGVDYDLNGEGFGPSITLVNAKHPIALLQVYPKSSNPPYADTLYLLPNEYFYSFGYITTEEYNFSTKSISAFHSNLNVDQAFLTFGNWNFSLPWLDNLENLGRVDTLTDPSSQAITWTASSTANQIDQVIFGSMSGYNSLSVGATANINFSAEIVLYNNYLSNPQDNSLWHSRAIKSIDGILGDVDGNGQVDNSDLAIIQSLYNATGGFNDYYQYNGSGINVGRAEILFSYPTLIDIWLLNVYINNPNDPLVKYLGIGKLLSTRARPIPVGYSSILSGNNLEVSTKAFAVRVSTILPSGKIWDTAAQVSNGKVIFAVPNTKLKYNIEAVTLPQSPAGVKEDEKIPTEFKLNQNYPNPFNPTTTISYSLPKTGLITLKVYDILGREVATLVNEEKVAGNYIVDFNASKLASGTYIYRITAGSNSEVKKMILMK